MADVGHQRFTKSVFYTPPFPAKSSESFHYQLFWCWLVLITVKMLVTTKNIKFARFCCLTKCWTNNEFSECFHACSWSMFVTSEYVTNKWLWRKKQCIQLASLSYKRVCSVMFKCAWTVRILTDTQAIDVVTFDFKGIRVRCFFSGSTDNQMHYF